MYPELISFLKDIEENPKAMNVLGYPKSLLDQFISDLSTEDNVNDTICVRYSLEDKEYKDFIVEKSKIHWKYKFGTVIPFTNTLIDGYTVNYIRKFNKKYLYRIDPIDITNPSTPKTKILIFDENFSHIGYVRDSVDNTVYTPISYTESTDSEYVLAKEGTLYKYSKETGNLVWKLDSADFTPALPGNLTYYLYSIEIDINEDILLTGVVSSDSDPTIIRFLARITKDGIFSSYELTTKSTSDNPWNQEIPIGENLGHTYYYATKQIDINTQQVTDYIEYLYLKHNNFVSLFTNHNGQGFKFEKVYSLPQELLDKDLEITSFSVDTNSNLIGFTLDNLDKVLLLDLTTNDLYNFFGETSRELDNTTIRTVDGFYTPQGILLDNRVIVYDSTNKRCQQIPYDFKKKIQIKYKPHSEVQGVVVYNPKNFDTVTNILNISYDIVLSNLIEENLFVLVKK